MNCKSPAAPKSPSSTPDFARDRHRLAVEKAARCFRLARSVADPAVARLLEEMGEDYLKEAERLQRGKS